MSVTPSCDRLGMTATQHRFAPPDMDRDPDAGRPREFDYGARCDELRCRTTKWLRSRRQELVKERRRLYVEVLAVLCVLDERDAAESASPGESPRLRERDRKTANNLKDEPDLAKAAHDGEVSEEQLSPASDLADSESDAEWAQRARNMSPGDLRNLANRKRKLTNDDARARREARDGRMWWRRDDGMLDARFSAPDLDGALIETVFRHLTDRMKPAKGERWDTLGHRNLDALVELCRNYAEAEPTGKLLHTLLVEVPLEGPATINGIPLPDDMIEALRAQARVEPFLVDDEGVPLANGKARTAIPPKIRRAVMLRRRALPLARLRTPHRPRRPPPHAPQLGRHRRPRQPRGRLHRRRHRPPRPIGPPRRLVAPRQPQPTRRPETHPPRRPRSTPSRTITVTTPITTARRNSSLTTEYERLARRRLVVPSAMDEFPAAEGHDTPEAAALPEYPPGETRVLGVDANGDHATVHLEVNASTGYDAWVLCERRHGRWFVTATGG